MKKKAEKSKEALQSAMFMQNVAFGGCRGIEPPVNSLNIRLINSRVSASDASHGSRSLFMAPQASNNSHGNER